MTEWVLVVWLFVAGGHIAPGIEIGKYRVEADCVSARDSIKTEKPEVGYVAMCVPRDK